MNGLKATIQIDNDIPTGKFIPSQSYFSREMLEELININKNLKTSIPIGILYNSTTTISVDTLNQPESYETTADVGPPVIPGYDRHQVNRIIGRNAPRITVINDGNDTLYTIVTSNAESWSTEENAIYVGETKIFNDVYELRIRSPTVGTPYRVTEYDSRIAYSVIRGDIGIVAQDINGNLICMMYGSNGTPVAQDVNDNLIAVMKGNYGGILKTWKVDSEGRGEMFLNDTQDVWGRINTVGLAEAAVRLGSIVSFDRRGTVFIYDDFNEAPLKWGKSFALSAGSTGHSVTLSNNFPHRGTGCIRVVHPNVIGDYSRAQKVIGGVVRNKIGMEINLYFDQTINYNPSIILHLNTGTRTIVAGIRIQPSGIGGLSYLHAIDPSLDASWTSFNTDFTIDANVFYPIKFVIDVTTETYVRCIFGGVEIDMTAYAPYTAASVSVQRIYSEIYLVALMASNQSLYCDDFVLTIEEP